MQDVAFDSEVKVGDKIKINHLNGEDSSYDGKEGTVEHIDSIGQLHGTWGGLAVIPGVDEFEIVKEECLKEDIPADIRERELTVLKTQAEEENAKAAKPKPAQIMEKIIMGRLKKNFKEICLNDQEFIKDPDQTVEKYLGKGKVLEMARFKVGEGIEKKEDDFAAEVAAQAGL
jgi:hypothetical protein